MTAGTLHRTIERVSPAGRGPAAEHGRQGAAEITRWVSTNGSTTRSRSSWRASGVRDEDSYNIGSDGPPDAAWLEAVLAWLRSVETGIGTAGLLRDARREGGGDAAGSDPT